MIRVRWHVTSHKRQWSRSGASPIIRREEVDCLFWYRLWLHYPNIVARVRQWGLQIWVGANVADSSDGHNIRPWSREHLLIKVKVSLDRSFPLRFATIFMLVMAFSFVALSIISYISSLIFLMCSFLTSTHSTSI